jgi:hypothetical protein
LITMAQNQGVFLPLYRAEQMNDFKVI